MIYLGISILFPVPFLIISNTIYGILEDFGKLSNMTIICSSILSILIYIAYIGMFFYKLASIVFSLGEKYMSKLMFYSLLCLIIVLTIVFVVVYKNDFTDKDIVLVYFDRQLYFSIPAILLLFFPIKRNDNILVREPMGFPNKYNITKKISFYILISLFSTILSFLIIYNLKIGRLMINNNSIYFWLSVVCVFLCVIPSITLLFLLFKIWNQQPRHQ